MLGDELCRGDGLGKVSGSGEWGEVAVLGDDVFRASGDRAIGENIVVGVVIDDLEVIMGSDPQECSGGEFHLVHQAGEFVPMLAPAHSGDDFFVFKKNPGGDGQGESACDPSVENREIGMTSGTRLQEDIGVQTDDHARRSWLRTSLMISGSLSHFPLSRSLSASAEISRQRRSFSACRRTSCTNWRSSSDIDSIRWMRSGLRVEGWGRTVDMG